MQINNIPENHPKDTRSSSEKEEYIIDLNILQDVLEETIGSYAIQNFGNIFDKDFQQILRVLEFSRGPRNHKIILAPDGFIRCISPKFPRSLLLEVHNALVGIVVFDAPEENK